MYHKNILNVYVLSHLSYNNRLTGNTDLEAFQIQRKSFNKNSYDS